MKKLLSFGTLSNRFRSGAAADPVRMWFILLAITGIFLAGVIGWNIWAFNTVAQGEPIGIKRSATTQVFDPATLQTIHSIFANRAAEETKYQTGVYKFSDPSQ